MTTILDKVNTLPYELANIVYSYIKPHPVAVIIREHTDSECDRAFEFCSECETHLTHYMVEIDNVCRDWWSGKCEYCYAEELGQCVYTCDECDEKTFEYGLFNNTENGLFCGACMMCRDEDGNVIDE